MILGSRNCFLKLLIRLLKANLSTLVFRYHYSDQNRERDELFLANSFFCVSARLDRHPGGVVSDELHGHQPPQRQLSRRNLPPLRRPAVLPDSSPVRQLVHGPRSLRRLRVHAGRLPVVE